MDDSDIITGMFLFNTLEPKKKESKRDVDCPDKGQSIDNKRCQT